MIVLPIIMIIVAAGLPLAYAVKLWRLDDGSRAAWLLAAVEAAMIVTVIVVFARWDIAGTYVAYAAIGVFLVCIAVSTIRHWRRPWKWRDAMQRSRHMLVSIALIFIALCYVVVGLLPSSRQVSLSFPLEGGRFVVGQGGGNTLLNRHHGHRQQRFAADITGLNDWGFRAAGLMPKRLDRYTVFGARVVSPCEGRVDEAVDGLPDLVPPKSDPDNAAGNHVTIDCGDAIVELAHLREGSLNVAEGDEIDTGAEVGNVGNSGNTTEPHLHVHAYDPQTGEGIEMSFRGRRPIRNRVFAR